MHLALALYRHNVEYHVLVGCGDGTMYIRAGDKWISLKDNYSWGGIQGKICLGKKTSALYDFSRCFAQRSNGNELSGRKFCIWC